MALQLKDINFVIGSVNPCGIGDQVYFIPKNQIAKWPVINDDFESAGEIADYASYKGDFELERGAKWLKLYSTQGKGKITWEYLGETDCKMVKNKASLSYPKLNDEGRAFAKYAANGDFVFIVEHDGNFYVIGHQTYRATLTPNGDSGDAPGSAKGITIEIECPDTTPLPRYRGNLRMTDGDLNTLDRTVTPVASIETSVNSIEFDDTELSSSDTATLNLRGHNLTGATAIEIEGTDAAMFSVSSASVSASDANASGGVDITVTFSPTTAAGDRTANLVITDETDNIELTIPLTGKGTSE